MHSIQRAVIIFPVSVSMHAETNSKIIFETAWSDYGECPRLGLRQAKLQNLGGIREFNLCKMVRYGYIQLYVREKQHCLSTSQCCPQKWQRKNPVLGSFCKNIKGGSAKWTHTHTPLRRLHPSSDPDSLRARAKRGSGKHGAW